MQKSGQVSLFIVIGLVIIIAMIFVFFLFRSFQEKAREITNPQEYLKSQVNDIKKVISKCIDESSREALTKISLQGGHFNPVKHVDYNGNKVSFLCYKIKSDEPCYNMMFTRKDIEEELAPVLRNNIKKCVDLSLISFKNKDYSLSTGEFNFNFNFNDDALLVTLNYPVTLVKNDIEEIQDKFTKEIKSIFWKSAALASFIVNAEARGDIVDLTELSPSNLYFEIGRTHVVGGNLYMIVSRSDTNNIFYFAVET